MIDIGYEKKLGGHIIFIDNGELKFKMKLDNRCIDHLRLLFNIEDNMTDSDRAKKLLLGRGSNSIYIHLDGGGVRFTILHERLTIQVDNMGLVEYETSTLLTEQDIFELNIKLNAISKG